MKTELRFKLDIFPHGGTFVANVNDKTVYWGNRFPDLRSHDVLLDIAEVLGRS